MWTVVHISANRVMAEQIKEILSSEGLLVMIKPMGIPHLGDSGTFEVLVPESEAAEANEILVEKITPV
ncbi:MAG: glutamate decarboxylase [Peptococcia bacterium]